MCFLFYYFCFNVTVFGGFWRWRVERAACACRPACSVCSGTVAALEKELNGRVCLAASGWSTAACCIIIFLPPLPPRRPLLQRQPEGGGGSEGKERESEEE